MRLTTSDLLLSGWHNICNENGSFWAHEEYDRLVPFNHAAKVERFWREDYWSKRSNGGKSDG